MQDFRTEQDVDTFVAGHAPGLGRLVLSLRLADGRLAGEGAELARQWLLRHPAPGAPLSRDGEHFDREPHGAAPELVVERSPEVNSQAVTGHGGMLVAAAGLFGVALLVGSAWLPVWR